MCILRSRKKKKPVVKPILVIRVLSNDPELIKNMMRSFKDSSMSKDYHFIVFHEDISREFEFEVYNSFLTEEEFEGLRDKAKLIIEKIQDPKSVFEYEAI